MEIILVLFFSPLTLLALGLKAGHAMGHGRPGWGWLLAGCVAGAVGSTIVLNSVAALTSLTGGGALPDPSVAERARLLALYLAVMGAGWVVTWLFVRMRHGPPVSERGA